MRILQVLPFFSPSMGGSARVVYDIARHLGHRGHDVTVVASDFRQEEASFPPGEFRQVLLSSVFSRWGFYYTPSLIGWMRDHIGEFEVIHLHEVRTFQNAVTRRYALRRGIPYVLSAHGTLPVVVQRKVAKRIYDLLFGRALMVDASRVLAVSPVELDQYAKAGIEPERIALVPNGLSLEEFYKLPSPGTLRTRLGIANDVKIVLYLGRLHLRKGIDHLINAFAHLHDLDGNVLLAVVGPDEGELTRLHAMVNRLGLDEKVRFLGPLYGWDKLAAYVDAQVLAYPAVHEIFGLVPFEALMCGTPVVVTDDCGCGHLISDAEAGYLVSYGDVEALSSVLHHALNNSDEGQQKVRAGQAYIRDRLHWEVIIDDLEGLYKELSGIR